MKTRNINLDVIRSIALIYILCVHFFLYSDFYYIPIIESYQKIAVILRCCFMSCVPLFLMLTGYLMNKKTLSLKYYLSISKILTIYGLSCVAIWIFRTIREGIIYDLKSLFRSYISYELYAWYIGMYLCIYMLIPFLNTLYHSLETKQKKIILLITLIALTGLPSLVNRFGVNYLPTYFESFYPLTYYFMGVYLSEYEETIKLPPLAIFVLYFIAVILGGSFANYFVEGQLYIVVNVFSDYNNILSTCASPLLFLALLKCDFSKFPKPICKMFEIISLVSLQLYLVSWIFDTLVYEVFKTTYTTFLDRLLHMPLAIIAVFIPSFMVALIIHYAYLGIKKISTP